MRKGVCGTGQPEGAAYALSKLCLGHEERDILCDTVSSACDSRTLPHGAHVASDGHSDDSPPLLSLRRLQ